MRHIIKQVTFIVLFVFSIVGCAPIKPFTATPISDKPDLYVTQPAPINVRKYDASVADQWERTYNMCSQRELALSQEIEERKLRLSNIRTYTLIIGGVAGLASGIYSGIANNPQKGVVIPLAAISGTSLLTAIPALGNDDRLTELSARILRVKNIQIDAKKKIDALDAELVLLNFIYEKLKLLNQAVTQEKDPAKNAVLLSEQNKQQDVYEKETVKLSQMIGTLRDSISAWEFELK